MKKQKAIYKKQVVVIKNGTFIQVPDDIPVRVMAVAEGYAMVRRKGKVPFVVNESELIYEEGRSRL